MVDRFKDIKKRAVFQALKQHALSQINIVSIHLKGLAGSVDNQKFEEFEQFEKLIASALESARIVVDECKKEAASRD